MFYSSKVDGWGLEESLMESYDRPPYRGMSLSYEEIKYELEAEASLRGIEVSKCLGFLPETSTILTFHLTFKRNDLHVNLSFAQVIYTTAKEILDKAEEYGWIEEESAREFLWWENLIIWMLETVFTPLEWIREWFVYTLGITTFKDFLILSVASLLILVFAVRAAVLLAIIVGGVK